MIDIQNHADDRNIPLKKVGVKNLRYPIVVLDKVNKVQHTSATVNLFADLPHFFKGTHMSRFIEVFNNHRANLTMPRFLEMLDEIRAALEAETAYGDITFPYYVEKKAPVSGEKSIMCYDCTYSGETGPNRRDFFVTVQVPVTTVCPCSKAISQRGAHNQRGIVSVRLKLGLFFWIEDIIAIVEESASSDVFSLLKREDEKFITERAYDNPRFVEDVVREVYVALEKLGNFPYFLVEAENFESIHNHSAYACAEFHSEH
jgi:GTP cyclohydrolase I